MSSTPGVSAVRRRRSGSSTSARDVVAVGVSPPRERIHPLYGVHRSIELRTAPCSSMSAASPSFSIVGVALGWMKCVQTVL